MELGVPKTSQWSLGRVDGFALDVRSPKVLLGKNVYRGLHFLVNLKVGPDLCLSLGSLELRLLNSKGLGRLTVDEPVRTESSGSVCCDVFIPTATDRDHFRPVSGLVSSSKGLGLHYRHFSPVTCAWGGGREEVEFHYRHFSPATCTWGREGGDLSTSYGGEERWGQGPRLIYDHNKVTDTYSYTTTFRRTPSGVLSLGSPPE